MTTQETKDFILALWFEGLSPIDIWKEVPGVKSINDVMQVIEEYQETYDRKLHAARGV